MAASCSSSTNFLSSLQETNTNLLTDDNMQFLKPIGEDSHIFFHEDSNPRIITINNNPKKYKGFKHDIKMVMQESERKHQEYKEMYIDKLSKKSAGALDFNELQNEKMKMVKILTDVLNTHKEAPSQLKEKEVFQAINRPVKHVKVTNNDKNVNGGPIEDNEIKYDKLDKTNPVNRVEEIISPNRNDLLHKMSVLYTNDGPRVYCNALEKKVKALIAQKAAAGK